MNKVLDRYLIAEYIPNLIFALVLCTILSELIGISFEQIKFLVTDDLPIMVAVWIHYLKLPAFIVLSLPLSILMGTIVTYANLSAKQELVALQSAGISWYRLIAPTLVVSLAIAVLMFALQEFVVPPANYQAAIVLEREWGVDRTQLAKYHKRDIVYQKFTDDAIAPSLEFLFFANLFDGQQLQEIILLQYHNHRLKTITTAKIARWNEERQLWQLLLGQKYIIDENGFYQDIQNFQRLPVKLSRDILDYASRYRDLREMNLRELYRRMDILHRTNDRQNLRELKVTIQERYAHPFSCIALSCLGATLGSIAGKNSKLHSFTLAAIAIFIYYAAQFLATVLSTSGALPVVIALWLPNAIALFLAYYYQQVPDIRN